MGRINVTSSIFAEPMSSNIVLMTTAEMLNDCCLKQDILAEQHHYQLPATSLAEQTLSNC